MVYLLLGQASGPDRKPLVIELIISVDPTVWTHADNLQVRLTIRIAMGGRMSSILFLLRILDGDGDMILVLDVGTVVVSGRMRDIRATSMLVASLVLVTLVPTE